MRISFTSLGEVRWILGLLLLIAAFGTFIVYKFFDNISVRMKRHAIVNEIEMKMNTLFSAEFAE